MRSIFILILALQTILLAQQPASVLKLNWGTGDNAAGFRRAPEAYYGPQAFVVTQSSVWLLDSQNGRLKEFVNGQWRRQFTIPPFADDFYFNSPDDYAVLSQNTVYFYRNGHPAGEYRPSSPRAIIQSIRSIAPEEVAINFADGRSRIFNRAANRASAPEPIIRPNKQDRIRMIRLGTGEARIGIDGNAFTLNVPQNNLASLHLLGTDARGRLFVNFEYFVRQVPLKIRREISVLTREGRKLVTLNVPVNSYTEIFRDIFVDPGGALYQMISTERGVEIIRWDLPAFFNDRQPPIIEYPERFRRQKHYNWLIQPAEPELPGENSLTTDFSDYPQVLPGDALSTGDAYVQLLWNCTADNLTNGVITDPYGYLVQTPDWIQIGQNQRVPYKWGGFESIEQFVYGLSINKYAGDKYTNKPGGTPSAVGVDCSGFVSRCWNLPFHYSTRTMDDALALPYATWQEAEPGDAVHKPGHVRLLVQQNGNGSLLVVESAGRNWRVSYKNYFYSDLTAYTPRYYVNRQGAPGNIPQPRFDLAAETGGAQLHWSMAGQENTDAVRLYAAADGATWNLIATLPDTTSHYSVPVADGEKTYYRLTSISSAAGNPESVPSDAYGVYRNDGRSRVLIVDGFDRTSATNGSWNRIYHSFAATHGEALYANGIPFETVDNDAVLRGDVSLGDYPAVFWILGDESTHDGTFTKDEQALVAAYLQQGGRLFVSGSEIGWDLWYKGTAYDHDFFANYLKATFLADNSQSYTVTGQAGTPFAGLTLHFDNGSHGVYDVAYPDVISTANGSAAALNYANGYGAAVSYDGLFPGGSAPGKLVYLGFPFETIYSQTERNALMAKVVDFFGLNSTTAIAGGASRLPDRFVLYGNFPNPFNGRTAIRFRLPASAKVQLQMFNSLGQSVLNKTYYYSSPGIHKITVSSDRFSSGIYFYRLSYRQGNSVQTQVRSMLIVK